jgi:glycogen operon protein
MAESDWATGFAKSFAVFLNGRGLHDFDGKNEPILDDDFLLLFNAHFEALDFRIPVGLPGGTWTRDVQYRRAPAVTPLDGSSRRFLVPQWEDERLTALLE